MWSPFQLLKVKYFFLWRLSGLGLQAATQVIFSTLLKVLFNFLHKICRSVSFWRLALRWTLCYSVQLLWKVLICFCCGIPGNKLTKVNRDISKNRISSFWHVHSSPECLCQSASHQTKRLCPEPKGPDLALFALLWLSRKPVCVVLLRPEPDFIWYYSQLNAEALRINRATATTCLLLCNDPFSAFHVFLCANRTSRAGGVVL